MLGVFYLPANPFHHPYSKIPTCPTPHTHAKLPIFFVDVEICSYAECMDMIMQMWLHLTASPSDSYMHLTLFLTRSRDCKIHHEALSHISNYLKLGFTQIPWKIYILPGTGIYSISDFGLIWDSCCYPNTMEVNWTLWCPQLHRMTSEMSLFSESDFHRDYLEERSSNLNCSYQPVFR